MFMHSCVFPRAFSTTAHPQLPLPLLSSEGEVGGDGSEEIEHLGLGLNGHVNPRASGCQMMDGVGTGLQRPSTGPQPPSLSHPP